MRIFTTSAAVVLLSGLGAATSGAVVPTACDSDSDSYVTVAEARACTEQRFEEVRAGQNGVARQQFGEAVPGVENPEGLFGRVDQNGDGQISRREWVDWQEQSFAAATSASEGRMPTADYQSMQWLGEAYTRPTPEAGQTKQ